MVSNTNKQRKTSGFTIVELLIVIVVIGILAAITIVAYNGVQARANNTKIDALAKEISDKSEVSAADNNGTYPTVKSATPTAPAVGYKDTAALSTKATADSEVIATRGTAPSAAGKITIFFCAAGVEVTPYDYVTKGAAGAGASKLAVRVAGVCP